VKLEYLTDARLLPDASGPLLSGEKVRPDEIAITTNLFVIKASIISFCANKPV
jgi:hypothetical protein